jgi:hypothetical protein
LTSIGYIIELSDELLNPDYFIVLKVGERSNASHHLRDSLFAFQGGAQQNPEGVVDAIGTSVGYLGSACSCFGPRKSCTTSKL